MLQQTGTHSSSYRLWFMELLASIFQVIVNYLDQPNALSSEN
jgi:hypothetical protein